MSHVQDQVNKSLKLVGRVLGDKFKLTACIGIGGSGAVYRADQIALGRTVAVKILNEELSADTRMIKRFRDEAMSASRLNHPNCVSIIDYGQSPDGLLYLPLILFGRAVDERRVRLEDRARAELVGQTLVRARSLRDDDEPRSVPV